MENSKKTIEEMEEELTNATDPAEVLRGYTDDQLGDLFDARILSDWIEVWNEYLRQWNELDPCCRERNHFISNTREILNNDTQPFNWGWLEDYMHYSDDPEDAKKYNWHRADDFRIAIRINADNLITLSPNEPFSWEIEAEKEKAAE